MGLYFETPHAPIKNAWEIESDSNNCFICFVSFADVWFISILCNFCLILFPNKKLILKTNAYLVHLSVKTKTIGRTKPDYITHIVEWICNKLDVPGICGLHLNILDQVVCRSFPRSLELVRLDPHKRYTEEKHAFLSLQPFRSLDIQHVFVLKNKILDNCIASLRIVTFLPTLTYGFDLWPIGKCNNDSEVRYEETCLILVGSVTIGRLRLATSVRVAIRVRR